MEMKLQAENTCVDHEITNIFKRYLLSIPIFLIIETLNCSDT